MLVECYDPKADQWNILQTPILEGRSGPGCAVLDDSIYLVGGYSWSMVNIAVCFLLNINKVFILIFDCDRKRFLRIIARQEVLYLLLNWKSTVVEAQGSWVRIYSLNTLS